ncbi:2-hydroxyacid dehydrogenase [Undibacterium luofuense]|uniref:Glyoxylate/hydroxypyruvate reductase A n=1 Tax=Undibacterium luofuense TaxID=2828733 RepID=A0A941DMP0_9BURK|nr:glyoxylate/hydroxypyruvate reductase A [Undibacterium luofuense]MBR7784007.1 glyoxylate/hydroxypyruvate reductase A [Undibacterium luofuense]
MSTIIPFIAAPGYRFTTQWVEVLQQVLPECTVVPVEFLSTEQRALVQVAVVANPDPQTLRLLPNLKWVHSVWAGVERLLSHLQDWQLPVVRLKDPELARTMAEAVLAWSMYLHRDMPAYRQLQTERRWQPLDYIPARARRIGVLGAGALGGAAMKLLQQTGFQVAGWSRSGNGPEGISCFSGEQGLQELVTQTDILVLLLPLTPQTRGLVNAALLKKLPAGAALINFARGDIVNDADLRTVIDSGHLRHAVLDVFSQEPLPPQSWHWSHPSVTVLPHISAPTSRDTAAQIVAENLRRWLASGVMPETVDLQQGY